MNKQSDYIKDYKIIQLLGEGQDTKVFLAQKENTSRYFAVKIFSGPYLTDSSFKRRLEREFNITKSIQHPNLVQYFEMGEFNRHPFIVMEYLGQATLERLLAQHGRSPASIAVSIMIEALKGLSFLHSNGIVHRDIKPSAIFLTKSGRVVLADFDIAKPINDTSLTIKRGVIGSPRYMAPEQRLGENASVKSDVFSAGVTLYEMLTGETPWKDVNHLPTDRRAWASIIRPSKLSQSISLELDEIVLKAIDLQPGRRFETVDEMADELKKMRYAPQSDLIAWASGRKSNINSTALENKKIEERVKIKKHTIADPKGNLKNNVGKEKTAKINPVLWGSLGGILICLFVAGFFLWQSFGSKTAFFQDTFSDQQTTASQWSSVSGNWQIVNGSYFCSTSDSKCLSLINSIPEGNFTLSVDVYGQDGVDKSVYFGVMDQKYFRVSLRSGPENQIILYDVSGNQSEKILAQTAQQISNQTWYKLKLVFTNQTISIYIDGNLVISTTNPISQQSGGKVGVGIEPVSNTASTVNSAAFDNIEIFIDN